MSRIVKMFALTLMVLVLGSVMLVACARPGSSNQNTVSGGASSSSSSDSSGGTQVTMAATNFDQASVTISKGSSITLSNTSSAIHLISNGIWDGVTAKTETETGAPKLDNLAISAGQSLKIGPFPTAGTFHLYCTVHAGMNLTVIVQ